jgi:hypothetical protein
MKKFICLALVLVMCLAVFCSCEQYLNQEETKQGGEAKDRFFEIYYNKSYSSGVFVDKETRVQYFVNYHGGITPLIDENGKPLLYEGELE